MIRLLLVFLFLNMFVSLNAINHNYFTNTTLNFSKPYKPNGKPAESCDLRRFRFKKDISIWYKQKKADLRAYNGDKFSPTYLRHQFLRIRKEWEGRRGK